MKRFWAWILILMLALPVAFSEGTCRIGEVVPDFTVTTIDGEEWTLSEQLATHKAVLLNFWFVNCGWCAVEFPGLNRDYLSCADDVVVLALNGTDSEADIAAYRAEYGLSLPMAKADPALLELFQVYSFPTSILIDRNGVYCGNYSTQPDNGAFTRLFAAYTGSDYDAPLLNYAIPDPEITAEQPSEEALCAALNAEGCEIAWNTDRAGENWPFVLAGDGDGVISSNHLAYTQSVLHGTVTADAGDVFTMEFQLSAGSADRFLLFLDGVAVECRLGEHLWCPCARAFETDGEHQIAVCYRKDLTSTRTAGESSGDFLQLKNARILTGADAEEALAAAEAAFDDQLNLEPVDPEAREILVEGGLASDFEGRIYLVGDSLDFVVQVGADLNFEDGGVAAPDANPAHQLYYVPIREENGQMLVTGELLPNENSGLESGLLCVFATTALDKAKIVPVLFFRDEAHAEDILREFLDVSDAPLVWRFANEAPTAYTFTFRDISGEPVEGVVVNVCGDTSCAPVVSGADGVAVFEGAEAVYTVHVLSAPEGFSFDPSEEYCTGAEYGSLDFTLTRN